MQGGPYLTCKMAMLQVNHVDNEGGHVALHIVTSWALILILVPKYVLLVIGNEVGVLIHIL